jgi:hypothetical protein
MSAEAQVVRALVIYLKSEVAKVPLNSTLTVYEMDLDRLSTVEARAAYAYCTLTMVAMGT